MVFLRISFAGQVPQGSARFREGSARFRRVPRRFFLFFCFFLFSVFFPQTRLLALGVLTCLEELVPEAWTPGSAARVPAGAEGAEGSARFRGFS